MCINMNIGGTEKALLNMVNQIDNNKYEITLVMLEKYGGFLKQIPSFIKVLYINEYKYMEPFIKEPPQLLAKKLIKDKSYIKGFGILINYSISKFSNDLSYYYRYLLRNVKLWKMNMI